MTRLKGVNSGREHGTAFVIDASGYLVTNYHVVVDALSHGTKYELVLTGSEGSLQAQVMAIDAVNDLALVKVEHNFSNALKIAANPNMEIGETVFSLGFPKSEQVEIIQGTFNGINEMGFAPVMRVSMPLNPGMSGGPCLNSKGEVVGVNRAMLLQAQNISYLSPLDPLQKIASKPNPRGCNL